MFIKNNWQHNFSILFKRIFFQLYPIRNIIETSRSESVLVRLVQTFLTFRLRQRSYLYFNNYVDYLQLF